MHTCTNCAHNAALGGDAASVCTNCGSVAADMASVAPIAVYGLAALGAAYLAFRAAKAIAGALRPQTA